MSTMVLNTVGCGCVPYFIRYRPLLGNWHVAVFKSTPSEEEMSVRQRIQGVAVVKQCKTGFLDEAFGTTVGLCYLVSNGVQLVLGCMISVISVTTLLYEWDCAFWSRLVNVSHNTTLSECVCMFDTSGWVVNPYPARSASCLASFLSFTLWAIVPAPACLYWLIKDVGVINKSLAMWAVSKDWSCVFAIG